MTQTDYDVVCIGNAIVDVLAKTDDAFLKGNRLTKGAMTLIDAGKAELLYSAMGPGVEISGGSAANTAAGIASLGGKAGYIGKVCDDQLGAVFRHDIRAAGVTFASTPAKEGPPTARCLIFITPDAQRTMQTYLGACVELGPDDIPEKTIASATVTYLEGYLWDKDAAKEAFRKAVKIAHGAGRKVALTLSDSFCVERHRDEFRDLVDNHVDIVFANQHEIESLYQVKDVEAAVAHLGAKKGRTTVITRSEKGSIIVGDGGVHNVAPDHIDKVVDTTGAGDLYAAGFLYGLTQGKDLPTSGKIASVVAAEIISHIGARPQVSLQDLVKSKIK
jgi:sugar/nucleoside kinase (ribokinase family)